MLPSYRDPRYAASVRLEQLQESGGELRDQIPSEIRAIHARRVARSAAGATAVSGFVLVALATAWNGLTSSSFRAPAPTFVLLGAALASIAVYVALHLYASAHFDGLVLASFDKSEDTLAKLARMESDNIRRAAARLVASNERASVGLPLAGVGLLAPLTIHLGVWALINAGRPDPMRWIQAFDWWIAATLILVGVAHGVLVYLAWRFARIAAESPTRHLERQRPVGGWAALGWTVAGSLLPGIIAIAIPPVIVFLTGALFVPYSFHAMHRRLVEERNLLESA